MELNIVKTTMEELTGDARLIVKLQDDPFTFIGFRGKVLMNRKMKGIRKLTAALETMWKHDNMMTQEAINDIDAAYDTIKQIAGENAARRACEAWRKAAEESRKKKAKAAALAWLDAGNDDFSDETWDLMRSAGGYDYDLLQYGFPAAVREICDNHRGSSYYKDTTARVAEAAFAYGFHIGQAVAQAKEATQNEVL